MILGVIPARGDSRGIAKKNSKVIAGKPLIAWTIKSAKQSKFLDRFVVSTEDREIADVSKKYGVEVIKRPHKLATNRSSIVGALQHVLSSIEAEIIVLLQPTSPVRDKDLIDRCIRKFRQKNADSLATGFFCKFMEYGTNTKRRQDLKGFFYDDGNIYVIKSDLIKKGKLFGEKIEMIITSREQNIDIDDEFDFWVAEQVLLKRIKEGKQT